MFTSSSSLQGIADLRAGEILYTLYGISRIACLTSLTAPLMSPLTQHLMPLSCHAGSHSGVKLCRWTKSMLRGRGGCYKHSFYGIESHRCMETTPSLACANKCVFCWRHHTNPGQSACLPCLGLGQLSCPCSVHPVSSLCSCCHLVSIWLWSWLSCRSSWLSCRYSTAAVAKSLI